MERSSGMHVHARGHIVISVSPRLVADDRESLADGGPGRQRLGQDEHGGWTRSGGRLPARMDPPRRRSVGKPPAGMQSMNQHRNFSKLCLSIPAPLAQFGRKHARLMASRDKRWAHGMRYELWPDRMTSASCGHGARARSGLQPDGLYHTVALAFLALWGLSVMMQALDGEDGTLGIF